MVWENGLLVPLRANDVRLVGHLVDELHAKLHDQVFGRVTHLGVLWQLLADDLVDSGLTG